MMGLRNFLVSSFNGDISPANLSGATEYSMVEPYGDGAYAFVMTSGTMTLRPAISVISRPWADPASPQITARTRQKTNDAYNLCDFILSS